jgi:alkanesulfonate monooxygenase
MAGMGDRRPLRFHWSLPSAGEGIRHTPSLRGPDLDQHAAFCRTAEQFGIESLLMGFGFALPDPFGWSAALGTRTDRIRFAIATRSGFSSPTYFVQQINTLSVVTRGRVSVNIVAGRTPGEHRYYGDFLTHGERTDRTDEFWRICHALWRADGPVDFMGTHYRVEGGWIDIPFAAERHARPEIYLTGVSAEAIELAIRHADCLLTLPEAPARLARRIRPVLDTGTAVGLAVSMIARPTRDEAVAAARALIETTATGRGPRQETAGDSAWVTRHLWTGAVPQLGAPAVALVGSPDDLVEAIFEYRDAGVTEFLFTGFPDLEQIRFFGAEILPRVRERERVTTPAAPAG